MTRIRIFISLAILQFSIQFEALPQFKSLSGIPDSVDTSILDLMVKYGFGKVTYYYDNINQRDGIWELYPTLKISSNLVAINISTIPGLNSKSNFLILVDPISKSIVDTLGPYYETYVDGIAVKFRKKVPLQLIVKLRNPPELNEPKYSIVEYKRRGLKYTETKTYNIDY
jgi:hypothetical protein